MGIKNIANSIKPEFMKHEPEILMGLGLGGLIFSTAWAIKATFSASKKLEQKKKQLQKDKLSFKEGFKTVWKSYLPIAISVGLSVPCIIWGNRVSAKRGAVLAAAYAMSEKALYEYKEQVKETVGEKKDQEIREKIEGKRVADTYNSNQIFMTGDGDCLFLEPISGRYFKSNWNKISKAANELNAKAVSDIHGVTTLSDWFDELGLSKTDISDYLGWSLEDGKSGIISVDIVSALTPDNTPCGSIHYKVLPRPY